MNKPPAFQFYADDFLSGTADMTAEEVGVYIRLLCHAWSKDGLDDNERLVMLAGQCQASSLAHAKSKFRLTDGKLRNLRQEKERKKQAEFRERQAENGKKRWLGIANPDATVKPPISNLQSPIAEREREGKFPECPPMIRSDFDAMAKLRGVPADCAEWFWNIHDARNWVDQSGHPIRKVEPLLLNTLSKWRQKSHQQATSASEPSRATNGTAEMILRTNELKRVEDRMREIRMAYESHQTMSQKDREETAQLKARRSELKKILGFKA